MGLDREGAGCERLLGPEIKEHLLDPTGGGRWKATDGAIWERENRNLYLNFANRAYRLLIYRRCIIYFTKNDGYK